ncbi:hypothetical protein FVE85_4896 [Porphyridium purpureum]|uniref:J domain-containing protein n=1 Tax=Porphyridium purpureum TaxID=35688 RepID=A0A5J4YQM4_PORPP|nr:hypothetical protein FVE85_4896 [Porphyridium purpureum]|eukprot:POR7321..scf236_6
MQAFVGAAGGALWRPGFAARGRASATPAARAVALRRGAASPLAMLFGGGKKTNKEQPSDTPKKKSSADGNPYRLLGVAEDATYEEIEAAYKRLSDKFAKEPKKAMFYEIQKEKIYDDRLQQRMRGDMQPRVKESPYDRKRREALAKKSFKDYLPAFIGDRVKVPSAAYFKRATILMGLFALACFAVPQFATSGVAMGLITSTYLLFNRDQPERNPDDFQGGGNFRDSTPIDRKAVLMTVGLMAMATGLGLGLAAIFMSVVGVGSFAPDSIASLFMLLGMYMACIFFKNPNGTD